MGVEEKMSRVILEIKEDTEAKGMEQRRERESFEDILLNAPVLTEEKIKNIENVGKEFRNWKIEDLPLPRK
jgi:hypothetical protein